MEKERVITIDGPSGVGKGTLAKKLAEKLGWELLDSGAIYRALALFAEENGLDLNDEEKVAALALTLPLEFKPGEKGVLIYLDGEDRTDAIRLETTGNKASIVAKLPKVRENLLQRQRDFSTAKGLIADGRDMGTVVFPRAPLKIFLTASAEERAKRRYKQLLENGICAKIEQILSEVKARDERDRSRKSSPLIPAEDAVIVDTSEFSADEVFEKVWANIASVEIN